MITVLLYFPYELIPIYHNQKQIQKVKNNQFGKMKLKNYYYCQIEVYIKFHKNWKGLKISKKDRALLHSQLFSIINYIQHHIKQQYNHIQIFLQSFKPYHWQQDIFTFDFMYGS
ncbi:unnamed protein product [Paramecium pentaurelia]|uniref:Uncharacterized protein n=1 Tax=Paramecium pentaurelia TaxID=43138 RepID=A0A8S1T530_9CILI|nr:unnamed protein product [Paramecium pentaurelia]